MSGSIQSSQQPKKETIGPGIPKNETRSQIVLNIDLMPTLLELTGMKKWAKLGFSASDFFKF